VTAAHSIKEPKPYDPTRTTGRIGFVGLAAMGAAETVTWLNAERGEGLLPLMLLLLGVVVSPLFTVIWGGGVVHAVRFGDKPSTDDLLGLVIPWALAVALAIYSGMHFATFALGILMASTVAVLRILRSDRESAQ
jgi:hypothetical protein